LHLPDHSSLKILAPCSVWDWRSRRRLSRFANGTGSGPITSLYFINEVSEALLLTASCASTIGFGLSDHLHADPTSASAAADGNVRLFRKYDDAGDMEVASAFRAVSTTLPSSTPSGTVTAWDQHSGNLYVAGDMDYIRVWDANRELTQAVRFSSSLRFAWFG
jgi:WD40 repeat protein